MASSLSPWTTVTPKRQESTTSATSLRSSTSSDGHAPFFGLRARTRRSVTRPARVRSGATG
eukprot:4453221-Pleurochrysis_carterae.AAC.1